MSEFWRGRKVFVTGHTGFKGSWLCLWLHQLGAQVKGFSLPPPTQPNLFEAAGVANVATTIIGDIRDHARLADELVAFAPDVVLHLAAQSVVLSAYENPLETFSTNVVGTASLLQAVVKLNADHGIALPEAMGMVTWKVADILGLRDRGHLKTGLRADLVRFKVLGATPVIAAVWSQGERAF